MSATRSATITTPNGSDKKSLADKSPRLSASSAGFIADSSHEVPPVPPLPPNVLASPPQLSPAFAGSVSESQKEEKGKERERSRTAGNWFSKKRKSLRLGDKGGRHENVLPQMPPSPFIVAEESSHSHPQHTGWFNRSNSSAAVQKSQPISTTRTSFDSPDPHAQGSSVKDRRPYGLEDFSQPSRSSSSSLLILGQSGTITTTELSPSMSTSSVNPDYPHPVRGTSSTTPLEQPWPGVDQKKFVASNFPYHPVSSPEDVSNHHPLPPLPLNRLEPSNGCSPTDKVRGMEGKTLTPLRYVAGDTSLPLSSVPRSATLPPASLDVPLGTQDSNPVDHFQASRPPPRKLSLSTPILAFGRKDREREKR